MQNKSPDQNDDKSPYVPQGDMTPAHGGATPGNLTPDDDLGGETPGG